MEKPVIPINPAAQNAQTTLIAGCLFIITSIMLGVALSYTRSVMIPFAFALFLSYFIVPAVAYFQRRLRFPRWLATTASLLGFLLFMVGIVLVLRGSIFRMIDSFYLYEARLSHLAEVISEFAKPFGVDLDQASVLARIKDLPLFTFVQSAAGTVMTFVADFLLVMIFLIFLVSGKGATEEKTGVQLEINQKVRGYIVTKLITNSVTAVMIWIVLSLFGLDLAFMFSMFAFFLCFIPTLGSIVATLLPLPIALIQYDHAWPIWGVILFPALIQVLIGNFLEPKMLEKGLELHPVTILLSLMFWGLIWGLAGMFLAVPITAVMKILLAKQPFTRRLALMLGGRSPLRESN
ncbi:MAG: AI-2E family transporter [Bdellovibrionota bacterium]